MRRKWLGGLCGLSLLVLLAVMLAPTASATVLGKLSVSPGALSYCTQPNSTANGGVTVALTTIDWSPGSPVACLLSGINTDITSAAGAMGSAFAGQGTINDLNLAAPGAATLGFMRFFGGALTNPLEFNLDAVDGFGPGSAISCVTNPGLNNSCSIPGSPFVLTQAVSNSGVVGTFVGLSAHGYIIDPVDHTTSYWSGSFTTQIDGKLPADIQAIILSGDPLHNSITSTFSGEFDVTDVPEPVSMALIGGGFLALAALKRRKRA